MLLMTGVLLMVFDALRFASPEAAEWVAIHALAVAAMISVIVSVFLCHGLEGGWGLFVYIWFAWDALYWLVYSLVISVLRGVHIDSNYSYQMTVAGLAFNTIELVACVVAIARMVKKFGYQVLK